MGNPDNIKNKTISSLAIKMTERVFSTGMQLVISIILARILSPSDYGVLAIVNVFIALSKVFIESGFGMGLIQKNELKRVDINTIFISSFILSILIYFILFFVAPIISNFYNMPILTPVLRVYAITIIMASVNSIQNSILSRKLDYRKQLFAAIISTFVSGGVGIFFAFKGFGVWALVYQQIVQRATYLIVMLFATKYIPRFEFSLYCLKTTFSYSWKIVATRLLSSLFNEIRNLIIGKQYTDAILGFYNKGLLIPATVATVTDDSIQSVMFSVYSRFQNDINELKSMLRRSMKTSSYVLFPMMVGIMAVANPLVEITLTEKWLPCVPFLRIACLMFMLQPVNSANAQAINAIGKSNISLRIEMVKRTVAVALIFSAVFLDVYAMAFTAVLDSIFGWFLYMYYNNKLFKYSVIEQIMDIVPQLLISIIMGCIVYVISFLNINALSLLIIQILIGIVAYILLSVAFKIDSYSYLLEMIKSKVKDRNV